MRGAALRAALWTAIAASYLAACGHITPNRAQTYALTTTLDPTLLGENPLRREQAVTCQWLDDGRILAETRSEAFNKYIYTHQVWIEFPAPGTASVSVRAWNEERWTGSRWDESEITGTARISSGATQLGTAEGPDLLVEGTYRCMMSGSDKPGGFSFRLTSEQLMKH